MGTRLVDIGTRITRVIGPAAVVLGLCLANFHQAEASEPVPDGTITTPLPAVSLDPPSTPAPDARTESIGDAVLAQPLLARGDFNGDGLIDMDDVHACALAWKDREIYHQIFPEIGPSDLLAAGDFNDDGVFDRLDIEPFKSFIIAELTARQIEKQADATAGDEAEGDGTGADITDATQDPWQDLRPRLTIVDYPFSSRGTSSSSGGQVVQGSSNSGGGGGGGGSFSGGGGGGGGGGGAGGSGGSGASGSSDGSSADDLPNLQFSIHTGLNDSDDTNAGQSDDSGDAIDLNPVSDPGAVNTTAAELGFPTGPAGVTAPGPITLGSLNLTNLATAPIISGISDVTEPGDTMVMTGTRLYGASLRLWLPEGATDLSPLRSADATLQAVLPRQRYFQGVRQPVPHTTAVIAPFRSQKLGKPVRINAATAWWAWPVRAYERQPGQTIRFFGKNLTVSGGTPIAYLQRESGAARAIPVSASTPYTLEAELPDNLSPGDYRAWVHNGTGGEFGWSETIEFQVVPKQVPANRVFYVAHHLPTTSSHADAIQAAIQEAHLAGGGTVLIPAGTYIIDKPISLNKGSIIALRGAGAPGWNPLTQQIIGSDSDTTTLRVQPTTPEVAAISLRGNGARLSDLAIIDESTEHQDVVRLLEQNQTVKRCTIVRLTETAPGSCIVSAYEGEANHVIESCTLFGIAGCMRIAQYCDFVRITDCVMRASYASGRSTQANAVTNLGANHMILEGCDFKSVDRAGGKILGRTCLLYRSSIRNTYLANNTSESVGPHASVPGIEGNTGEQYLFHMRGEEAGNYNVTLADENSVTVGPGPLPGIVGEDNDWIVFVAKGRGAGQWRVIKRRSGNRLILAKPWAVTPQNGGLVTVQMAFRHNIVYGNTIDPSPDRSLIASDMKTTGITFWHLCFENIAANNTIRNTSIGVQLSSDFNTPSAWNLIKNNSFDHMRGYVGGSGFVASAYSEHTRGIDKNHWSKIDHWITVANIFRGNQINDAPAGGNAGWRVFENQYDRDYTPRANRGMVMSVFEHNRLDEVERGLLLAAPTNWAIARNNTVNFASTPREPIEIANPDSIYQPHAPSDADASFD